MLICTVCALQSTVWDLEILILPLIAWGKSPKFTFALVSILTKWGKSSSLPKQSTSVFSHVKILCVELAGGLHTFQSYIAKAISVSGRTLLLTNEYLCLMSTLFIWFADSTFLLAYRTCGVVISPFKRNCC